MRRTVLTLALCGLFSGPLPAQQLPGDAIGSTITRQIEAFRAEDFAGAFSYASPTIRRLFGTPENFGAMVRNGYPMVYNPRSVRMLDLREEGGSLLQRVLVTDLSGATHLLEYQMLDTPEGWQINAVQVLPQAGVGV